VVALSRVRPIQQLVERYVLNTRLSGCFFLADRAAAAVYAAEHAADDRMVETALDDPEVASS
jgi:hypothetical protein